MPTILPVRAIRKHSVRGRGQAERIIQLAGCEQPCIRGDHRATESKPQAAVEIELQRPARRFTSDLAVRRSSDGFSGSSVSPAEAAPMVRAAKLSPGMAARIGL